MDIQADAQPPVDAQSGVQPPSDTEARRQPAIHLLHGWWIASCPDCGYEFAQSRSQKRTERTAGGRRCPVCGTTMDPAA
jgi:ssDNA-binding Zn-finger/Zn-ribbon topoisomerase 1